MKYVTCTMEIHGAQRSVGNNIQCTRSCISELRFFVILQVLRPRASRRNEEIGIHSNMHVVESMFQSTFFFVVQNMREDKNVVPIPPRKESPRAYSGCGSTIALLILATGATFSTVAGTRPSNSPREALLGNGSRTQDKSAVSTSLRIEGGNTRNSTPKPGYHVDDLGDRLRCALV